MVLAVDCWNIIRRNTRKVIMQRAWCRTAIVGELEGCSRTEDVAKMFIYEEGKRVGERTMKKKGVG